VLLLPLFSSVQLLLVSFPVQQVVVVVLLLVSFPVQQV